MTHDEAADARPTKVRFLVLAASCSLAIVTYIHRVGFATASAEIREPLGLSDGQIGALMAAFMVAFPVFLDGDFDVVRLAQARLKIADKPALHHILQSRGLHGQRLSLCSLTSSMYCAICISVLRGWNCLLSI